MIQAKNGELQRTLTASTVRLGIWKSLQSFCNFLSFTVATVLLFTNVLIIEESHAIENEVPLMDKIVVTATRQKEKIAIIPANVTVISEQEIARSPAATVPELLRSTAGVLVNDISGNGRSITVDLRGFGETAPLNTLLLIDGRRVNQADLSGVDWTLIPKDRIQRIEIIHGGRGSVMYGDNAAGGVINIITKKGEEFKVTGGLALGSYDTFLTRAAVSGSTEKLSYVLSSNFRTSDGYRDNSETNAKDAGVNLEYMPSDRFNITLSGGYHEDDTRNPGSLKLNQLASGVSRTTSTTPDDFANIDDYYIQGTPQIFLTDTSYFKIDASSRTKKNDAFSSFVAGSFTAQTEIDTVAASPQVVIIEKIFGYESKLTAGFDYSENKEKINNSSVFFGSASTASYHLVKEDLGSYAHAEVSVSDAVAVSVGGRTDRVKFNSETSGTSDSVIMDESLFNSGVTYRFSDNASAYVGYSKSFRYPVLDEMFNFFTNTFATTLGPQTTDDFEIGALIQFGSDLDLSVNLFRLDTEKEIFFNPGSFANENLDGDTVRQGVELKISKRFSKLLLDGSYTFRDNEIDGGAFDGKEIPNVPTHQFTVAADAKLSQQIRLNMNGSYIGERRFISDFSNAHNDQESYFYVTAKLSYLFEKGSAYLTVKNILNEKYSEYGGIDFLGQQGFQPSPKINFLTGLNFEF